MEEKLKQELTNKENKGQENKEQSRKEENLHLTGIPTVALRGLTILPEMIIHFDLSREKSILAVEQAMMENQQLVVVTQKDINENDPAYEQVYPIGTLVMVKQVTKLPKQMIRVLIEGIRRVEVKSFLNNTEYLTSEVSEVQEENGNVDDTEKEAMLRTIKDIFAEYARCFPKIAAGLNRQVEESTSLSRLLDQITINIPLSFQRKQQVLTACDIAERFEVLAEILENEIDVYQIKTDLATKVKSRVDKNQRDYILREQLRYIREELGEDEISDSEQFEEAVSKLQASQEVKEKIQKEISRFKSVAGSSSESAVERAYIETLLELPWDKASQDNLDINHAENILNEQHYGLEKVKERVLEFLAVRAIAKKGDSPIICLVGPPGTGKTSIARSIAEALDKKYVRICLDGVRDEAEIRGHRKTYVGAMPGRIITGLKQAGVNNPLLLLDEIDKVSGDYKGDPASALLEVLDSEQNCHFRDHYVEIPVDLSNVLFLATANSTDTIPRPLLDRMEIIEVNSYTANEKFHIAKEHLWEKQLLKNGLNGEILQITDNALKKVIDSYTREAGVRGLERKLGELCRKTARDFLQNGQKKTKITSAILEKYLGKPKYDRNPANEKDEAGIVRGLAWTSAGGETLQIEVAKMPGKGEIDLTGQMGDVMKESALIALSYVRSISKEYGVADDFFKDTDFHIHIPEGAVPKDGPSAGITMATAILSAVTEIPVYAKVAMTGEITLRGKVLPIGGLKEKLLAAKMAGIEVVLVPEKNRKDVEEISSEIIKGMKIHYVETMEDVLKYSLKKEQTVCAEGVLRKGD